MLRRLANDAVKWIVGLIAAFVFGAAMAAGSPPVRPAAPGGACSATVPCTLQLTPAEVNVIEQALASAPIPANTSVPLIQKIDGQRMLQQRESDKPAQK